MQISILVAVEEEIKIFCLNCSIKNYYYLRFAPRSFLRQRSSRTKQIGIEGLVVVVSCHGIPVRWHIERRASGVGFLACIHGLESDKIVFRAKLKQVSRALSWNKCWCFQMYDSIIIKYLNANFDHAYVSMFIH